MSDQWKDGYREGYRDGLRDGAKKDATESKPISIPTVFPGKPIVAPAPKPNIPWPTTTPTDPGPGYFPPVTVCKVCGLEWKGVMGYSCPNMNCPVQPKITS